MARLILLISLASIVQVSADEDVLRPWKPGKAPREGAREYFAGLEICPSYGIFQQGADGGDKFPNSVYRNGSGIYPSMGFFFGVKANSKLNIALSARAALTSISACESGRAKIDLLSMRADKPIENPGSPQIQKLEMETDIDYEYSISATFCEFAITAQYLIFDEAYLEFGPKVAIPAGKAEVSENFCCHTGIPEFDGKGAESHEHKINALFGGEIGLAKRIKLKSNLFLTAGLNYSRYLNDFAESPFVPTSNTGALSSGDAGDNPKFSSFSASVSIEFTFI